MKKYSLLILIFALYCGSVSAQDPFFQPRKTDNVKIQSIGQDFQGVIWLGGENTLYAYDGIALFPLPLDSMAGTITSIFQDSHQTFWLGTSSGRIYQIDKSYKVIPFDIPDLNNQSPIRDILEDLQGRIWISTYGNGVFVWDFNQWIKIGLQEGLSALDIYDLCIDRHGAVWLATDNGISLCTLQHSGIVVQNFGVAEGLTDQLVTSLASDDDAGIWVGTHEGGLFHWTPEEQIFVKVPHSELVKEINSICVTLDGDVWVSTNRNGVWRCNSRTKSIRKVNIEIESNVQNIFHDRSGNIWLTLSNGKLLSAFVAIENLSLPFTGTQSLLLDSDNQLWIGTESGLYLVPDFENNQRIITLDFSSNLTITDLLEDEFGNIWITTLNKGLFVWNDKKHALKRIPTLRGKGGEAIMSVASAFESIWLSTLEGLVLFPASVNILDVDKNMFTPFENPSGSSLHYVYDMYRDSEGSLWVATDGNGVFKYDGRNLLRFSGFDSTEFKTVYSVLEYPQATMWFNTLESGLISFNGNSFTDWSGRTSGRDVLHAIAAFSHGPMVLVDEAGIELLQPETNRLFNFNADVGILQMVNGINAVCSGDKDIYIGNGDQLLRVRGKQLAGTELPLTFISAVKLYNEPFPFRSRNEFSHDENFIAFEYTGIWYSSPEDIRFEYRLDGYDLSWKKTNDREASYSRLDPGEYTFRVRASENDNFEFAKETVYTFRIQSPFWYHPLFILGASLVGALVLILIVKARESHSRRKAMLEREMVASQLAALKAQINPHFLFNSFNTLINLIDENADNSSIAIEYVEKLSDFFRHILQYREHDKITLAEEWRIVKDYVYLLNKRYGDNLKLRIDAAPSEGLIMPLTLQILLENAVKHNMITQDKPLYVNIRIVNGYIEVSNNIQRKTHAEQSTKFGLQSIATRYALSNQSVSIEDDGNNFQVRIPILK